MGQMLGMVFLEALRRMTPSVGGTQTRTIQAIHKEILARLEKIAFHFTQRESIQTDLRKLSGRDLFETSKCGPTSQHPVISKYRYEGDHLLSELVHLRDNVLKWVKATRNPLDELIVVDGLQPYRIAANYVNVLKHGIRGRNQKAAVADYESCCFVRNGEIPQIDDMLEHVELVINYDGELYGANDLIVDLIQIWEMFLRNHTTVDTANFRTTVGAVFKSEIGLATYSWEWPEGFEAEAVRQAYERKCLDIP